MRDVAAMHVRLLEGPGIADERFVASGLFIKMIDIARILRERLGAEARQMPTRVLPVLFVRFGALLDPLVRAVVNELGSVRNMDAGHAKAVLGCVPRPPEESNIDAARSLIDLGIVKVR